MPYIMNNDNTSNFLLSEFQFFRCTHTHSSYIFILRLLKTLKLFYLNVQYLIISNGHTIYQTFLFVSFSDVYGSAE